MPDYIFERECRTPHSECYIIASGEEEVGRVDVHYTPSMAYATLCVGEDMTDDDIRELVEEIDERLGRTTDPVRGGFVGAGGGGGVLAWKPEGFRYTVPLSAQSVRWPFPSSSSSSSSMSSSENTAASRPAQTVTTKSSRNGSVVSTSRSSISSTSSRMSSSVMSSPTQRVA